MSQVSSLNEGQERAVYTRGKDILVSAPAGSGKTKILVSRILELIKEGANVDQLLVLTFTQAAAGEMKQRLRSLLEAEISQGNEALALQIEKLPFAYITNFHGFCNQLISQYGRLIDIQPGYEILSDAKSTRDQAMAETLKGLYLNPDYYDFMRMYFPNKDDLVKCVLKLYETLQACGDRTQFIQTFRDEIYHYLLNHEDLQGWVYYDLIIDELRKEIELAYEHLEEAKLYCEEEGVVYFYERPLGQKGKATEKPIPYESYKMYLDELEASLGTEQMHLCFKNKPQAPYLIPWKDLGEEIKEKCSAPLTQLKKKILDGVKNSYEALFDPSKENRYRVIKTSQTAIETLLSITEQFETNYQLLKKEMNVLDFNDLERLATLLLSKEYGVAKDLNEQLVEIMIDEYQDSNQVQENLIQLIADGSAHHVPCFMVGDMKQSIYRFRQADPEIFKSKYDRYPTLETATRIDLGYNYRSRKVVLDSINFICNQVMDTKVGSLEYYDDPSAQLNYDFLRKEGCKDTSEYEATKQKAILRMNETTDDYTEILMVDGSSELVDDTIENSEYEAYMVAKRIIEGGWSFGEVAVLMRQTSKFITYKKVFDKLHIPTTIVLSTGFMQASEIARMMSVYRAFANPNDNLSMMSFLRSPFNFSNFSDDMIASVVLGKGESLYQGILKDGRFDGFVEVFESLRKDLNQLPFKQWNQRFFEWSGYLNRAYQMKNGIQRYQNLCLLLEKIAEKQEEIHTIENWIDYFENIGDANNSPAVVPKDQEAVTFMTIHKSKGLEFPIVFVSMHDKKFNLQDGKDRLIFDRKLTLAMKPRMLKDLEVTIQGEQAHFKDVVVQYDNVFLNLLSRLQNRDTISEELRIYYVALTRASKKLILTGTLTHEQLNDYAKGVYLHQLVHHGHYIYGYSLRKAQSFMDWLIPSILRHQDILNELAHENEYISKIKETIATPLEKQLENTSQARFHFQWYSYQELLDLPEIEANTEPKQALVYHAPLQPRQQLDRSCGVTTTEEDDIDLRGQITHGPLTATQKGTLVHGVFELLPLQEEVDVSSYITQLHTQGAYTDEEYACLMDYVSHIQAFYTSIIYQFCVNAVAIYREMPIMFKRDEQVVHGIIDLLIENEDGYIIVDYKTDQVRSDASEEQLVLAHKNQMTAYTQTLRDIYPNKKITSYLYYLHTNVVVKVF